MEGLVWKGQYAEHVPDSGGRTTDGGSSLGCGVDEKDDAGAKPNAVAFNLFVDITKVAQPSANG